MKNPYSEQPERCFWSPAVARRSMFDISELWTPKFKLTNRTKFATYGSCFAQHFSKALVANGLRWTSFESAPRGLSENSATKYNYNVFSSRTGNIYTTSLLLQWVNFSTEISNVPDNFYWEKDGRFYDPLRPNIEPNGFSSKAELESSRATTLRAFKRSFTESDVFVFTLGLTESWFHREEGSAFDGLEYAMCPGTIAGTFDSQKHIFKNQTVADVRDHLLTAIREMRRYNPKLKFLFTVSPVPLTATATNNHALIATSYSKSVLRAVVEEVLQSRRGVDYFPSFEIISSFPFKGCFFEPNLRNVNPHGVAHVMQHFFAAHKKHSPYLNINQVGRVNEDLNRSDPVCEEALLEAFGG